MPQAYRRLRRHSYLFVGLLIGLLALMLALEYAGRWMNTGVHAYMHANAVWTQAQKDGTRHLMRYAGTGDEVDLAQFEKAIAVPKAYRKAREAAQAHTLDWDRAREYLLEGGTDPKDTTKMIVLARHLAIVSDIDEALRIASYGDALIDQLREEADTLQAIWAAGPPTSEEMNASLGRISELDRDLSMTEAAFSNTIHREADQLSKTIFAVEVGAGLFIVLIGGGFGWVALYRDEQMRKRIIDREKRLRLALRGANLGLWDWDVPSGAIEHDGWLDRTLGYTNGGIDSTMDAWGRLLSPEDRDAVRTALDALHQGNDYYETEHRMRAALGEWRWIFAAGRVVGRDADGSPRRIIGVMRDVTERREVQKKLERSERLHRLTLGSISEAVFITDDQNAFTYVCPNVRHLFGYSRDEVWAHGRITALLGDGLFDSMTLEQKEKLSNIERTVTLPDSTSRTLLVSIKKVAIEGGTRLFTCRDITERKAMEDELRRSEQRYRMLIDQASDGIVITRPGGLITEANDRACEMSGYTKDELCSMRPEDLVTEASLAERPVEWDHYTDREPRRFERELRRKDGTTIVIELSARLIGEDVQAIMRDISAQKRHEAALTKAKERAEEMDRLKSAFLANISHEIRTPLTGIIGYAEILSGQLEGEQQEMIGIILESGLRLKETLTSILDIAQLESRSRSLNPTQFDLVSAIKSVVDAFRSQVRTKDVSLLVDVPGVVISAWLDRAALQRVLTNLVSNAVKFTESGSICVGLSASDDEIAITVQDTGVGISESHQDAVFNEFRQESEGFSRSYEGVGLGLPVTKRLVELMGGRLELESTKGIGTTVTVTLPRSPD